ncbi:hypothetical protein CDV36_008713 [Fusarium kuroshium]|uniref:Acyltransferase 3 domain-containing protein n=1 Tax=Fusarium kuroshium TaxID=2010991 RepID=A0A3M2S2Q6_9HYPO|nr:hypothetical protein CDV36_008713 [Fusarium kuroshium]
MSQSEYTALPRQEEIEIDSATNAIGSDSSRSSLESLVLPPPPPPSPWRVAANKVQKILVPSFLQRDGSAEDGPGQSGMVVAESNLLLLSEPAASDSSSSSNSNNSSDTERTWTEDFDLEKAPGKIPWYRKISSKAQKAGRKAGLIFMLILGLYVLSFPNKGAESTPGWMWMASLFKDNPGYAVNVWVSIGSTTVVWAISFIKGCQGVLETRLINYMGKISFSLYLVHGLGNQFIGKPLIDFMWNNFTGREPGFWKECSWLFAIALYIPILIWLADIFWRLVDAPSVTFAKMVEGKCFG